MNKPPAISPTEPRANDMEKPSTRRTKNRGSVIPVPLLKQYLYNELSPEDHAIIENRLRASPFDQVVLEGLKAYIEDKGLDALDEFLSDEAKQKGFTKLKKKIAAKKE